MGNTWSAELKLPRRIRAEIVEGALALLARHGFRENSSTLQSFITADGHAASIVNGVAATLIHTDGCVSLFDDDGDDIVLGVSDAAVSYGVLRGLHGEDSDPMARKFVGVWRDALEVQRPSFASLHDEWMVEAAWGNDFVNEWERYDASIAAREAPTFLSWQTYFEASWWKSLPSTIFERVRGVWVCEELAHGTLVRLGGDRPRLAASAVFDARRCEYR